MPKKSPGLAWQSPKIENACGSFPSDNPLSYTFCKLGSITSGITDHVFQFAGFRPGNCETEFDTETSVGVNVGTGVIGEKILGFGVAVGWETGAAANAGKVCVGEPTCCMAGSGVRVASAVQAVISTQTTKVKSNTRFMGAKYIGRKLSSDEYSYRATLPRSNKRSRKGFPGNLREALIKIYAKLAL